MIVVDSCCSMYIILEVNFINDKNKIFPVFVQCHIELDLTIQIWEKP